MDTLSVRRLIVLDAPFILLLVFRHRHGIDAGKPAVKIDVGAAPRAERPALGNHGLAADRADGAACIGHGANMGRAAKAASLLRASWPGLSRPSQLRGGPEQKDVDARATR